MANICSTTYKVFGPKEQLEQLKDVMEAQLRAGKREWDGHACGNDWCGWVVLALGGDPLDVYCRGEWEGPEWGDDPEPCLTFFVSSAWNELQEWRDFLERKFPECMFCYQAEELGCGIFVTNAPDEFEDKYILDTPEHGTEYFSCVESLCEAVKDAVKGSDPTSLEECRQAVEGAEDVFLFECEEENW